MSKSISAQQKSGRRARDLTGYRSGCVTVRRLALPDEIRAAGKREKPYVVWWLVDCRHCKKPQVVRGGELTRKKNAKISCRCLRSRDFTGEVIGAWTVLRRLKNRTASGQGRYLCQCECGRKKLVQHGSLQSGASRSCGKCGAYPVGWAKPKLKDRLRRESKETEVIRDERGDWFASRKATRYLSCAASTLWLWATSCPWLNGAGIEPTLLKGAAGQESVYYLKSDLDRVKKAMANSLPVPVVPDHIPIEDAAAKLGCSEPTLRKRLREIGVRPRKFMGKDASGRAFPRSFVPEQALADCRKQMSQFERPDKITRSSAAKILGVSPSHVTTMIARGELFAVSGPIICKNGAILNAWLLDRNEVWQKANGQRPSAPAVLRKRPAGRRRLPNENIPHSTPMPSAASNGKREIEEPLPVNPYPICAPNPLPVYHVPNPNVPDQQDEKTAPGETVHNADFTMVRWFGTDHDFALGVQSSAVRALWEEWECTGLGLHQETIRGAIDPERDNFRMDHAFRGHKALGTMIQQCGDGKYTLVAPDSSPSPKRKNLRTAPKSPQNHLERTSGAQRLSVRWMAWKPQRPS